MKIGISSRAAFLFAALVALFPTAASAGPWTRDLGHGYVNLAYARIAAKKLASLDGVGRDIAPYEQHAFQVYGEFGLIDRWLTATFEGQLFRWAQLTGQGSTYGLGDLRLGFWTGLVTRPVRLTAALLLGIPSGDPAPLPGDAANGLDPADPRQREYATYLKDVAAALPTGDGEADVELRLSLGHSFGGVRRWPFEHYLVLEAGYWWRTRSRDRRGNLLASDFFDALTYKFEIGIKFPWKFIDRFWFIFRMPGVVSLAIFEDPAVLADRPTASCVTGLGNGVSYLAWGFEALGRIYKGLGASAGFDSGFAARCVAAGANVKFGLSYEF